MRLLKFAFIPFLLSLLAAAPALAGNTTLYSSTNGDVVFPFTAPTTNPAAAGAIDNMIIGATTAKAGTFTTITGTSSIAGPVAATTLSASGAVALSPASAAVVLSPTGTGVVTINPATASTIDNEVIGGTTPLAGTFTTVSAAALKGTGTAPVPTGTGTPTIAAGSTNLAGEVTAGASATSVVITFNGAPLSTAPFCVVRTQSQLTSFVYAISTIAITVTQTATSANLIDYICVQH